jgi:hypothetical protein
MFDAVNKSGKQRGRPFRPGASGNPRGRPRGSLNKRTQTLLEAAEAGGEMPLDFLLRLMRDRHSPMARRLEAAKAAAPFLHPKLSAIDAKLSLTGSKFLAALRPVYFAVLTSRPFNPSAQEPDISAQNTLESLTTAQAGAVATLQIGSLIETLSDSIVDLGSTSQVREPAKGLEALAKIEELAARAGDSSNLTLDTDLDSYYVQNILVDQLPKLPGRLGRLQIVPAQASNTITSSSEDKVGFLVLDGLVKSTTDEIKSNLKAAYRGSADGFLKGAIDSKFSVLFSAVEAYLAGRRASIVDGVTARTDEATSNIIGNLSCTRRIVRGQYRNSNSIGCYNCELTNC